MSLADRMRFQMHVGMCKHCRAYLRQMKATIGGLGQVPDDPMPTDVRDEMRKRFAAWNDVRLGDTKKKPEPT